MKKIGHQITPSPIRIPDTLKRRLLHEAVDNRRSLNLEVVYRLEQSLVQQDESQAKKNPAHP